MSEQQPPASNPPASATSGTAKGAIEVHELTRVQVLIARRAAESRATVPAFEAGVEVDMEACLELRAGRKAEGGSPVPTITDLVVKACAIALREHPRLNGAYRDARFELHERVNVGVMVAATDALYTPVLPDTDSLPLDEISSRLRAAVERVRSGAITAAELSGGTFTVSNLGMHGVSRFGAVITPPQAAILAVGAVTPRAVVRDGEVVARHVMDVTLACDHRIVYGVDAAGFLARIRGLLEAPAGALAQ